MCIHLSPCPIAFPRRGGSLEICDNNKGCGLDRLLDVAGEISSNECDVGVVTARFQHQIGCGSWDATDPIANLYDNE